MPEDTCGSHNEGDRSYGHLQGEVHGHCQTSAHPTQNSPTTHNYWLAVSTVLGCLPGPIFQAFLSYPLLSAQSPPVLFFDALVLLMVVRSHFKAPDGKHFACIQPLRASHQLFSVVLLSLRDFTAQQQLEPAFPGSTLPGSNPEK